MIVTAIVVPIALLLMWILSGYLPTRNIAMPTYIVTAKTAEYEIREYDPFVIAETSQAKQGESGGFNELFRYISGDNSGEAKISMTAPVLKSDRTAGKTLAMTAPVLKQGDEESGSIAFVMPPGFRFEDLPQPTSPKIVLREIPRHKVAAVTFSGYAKEEVIKEKTERLLAALQKDGLVARAVPTTALYNPPWTPPFMRRNEILVEIE